MNLSMEQKQICGCQWTGEESGMDWEFGVRRCELLHLEWISNEVLLYIIRKYIQLLVIEQDRSKMRKIMCIYA